MGTSLTTIVALSILGGPLGVSHEAQLCALAEKCHSMPQEIPTNPMRLTPSMADFVARHVNRDLAEKHRLGQLVWAIRNPKTLGFHYLPDVTRSAQEAFDARSGDCVSFSLMFVALARHAGLDARFQLVRCTRGKRQSRGLNAATRHMNAVVVLPRGQCEIDVTQPLSKLRWLRNCRLGQRKSMVADRYAWAAFFNNRTVDMLSSGDHLLADRLSRAAVNLAPECAQSWVNFGVCQRLLGRLETAEAAYLRALSCQPRCRQAKRNLDVLRELIDCMQVAGQ